MAQNRRSEAEEQDGSSSEEEEGSSEENEEHEESESESEEDNPSTSMPKKSSAPKQPENTQISAQPQSSSSDECGSESESDSDFPPNITRRADPNVKPIASKPLDEPSKATKKPRSKPTAAFPPTKSTTVVKRAADSGRDSNRDSKKAKRKEADAGGVPEEETTKKAGDDAKKQLFQRLWSEEDEIVILKGMMEYMEKKGADPVADMNAFHDFIKKSLHIDVSKAQLSDKVRRLKKKYENNVTKGKKGEDRTFSKPHEQTAYELSKKIWGAEANGAGADSSNTKVNGRARKNQNQRAILALPKVDEITWPDRAKEGTKVDAEPNEPVTRSVRFDTRSIAESSLEEEIVRNGLDLISGPKKSELEEKWKKLKLEEVELYLKRVDLIREQTKLVLEALKSSDN